VKILGLVWLGTRTARYDDTTAFFRDVLGLPIDHEEPGFAVLDLPDGATVEVFGVSGPHNPHLTHPVAGLRVEDLGAADAELRAAGTEIVLPIQRSGDGAWLHFRAPDGFLYELTERYAGAESDPDARALIERCYAAFNARDVDAALGAMHDDVDWPNAFEGGRVHGRAAVGDYWRRQFDEVSPTVEPVAFATRADGSVAVVVHQVVRDRAGAAVLDRHVQHVYTLAGGLIVRMDVRD
jgi:predicted enzyme related to lactoylglutathione lyase